MKTTIIAATIVLLVAASANAIQYRGAFETVFTVLPFDPRPATVTIDATSDGVKFQIDSIEVVFTDTMAGRATFAHTTLDPISVSIDLFTPEAPLFYVPGSTVASITAILFGFDVHYIGVYRQPGSFDLFDTELQVEPNGRNVTLLFDFVDAPNEVALTFDTFPPT